MMLAQVHKVTCSISKQCQSHQDLIHIGYFKIHSLAWGKALVKSTNLVCSFSLTLRIIKALTVDQVSTDWSILVCVVDAFDLLVSLHTQSCLEFPWSPIRILLELEHPSQWQDVGSFGNLFLGNKLQVVALCKKACISTPIASMYSSLYSPFMASIKIGESGSFLFSALKGIEYSLRDLGQFSMVPSVLDMMARNSLCLCSL